MIKKPWIPALAALALLAGLYAAFRPQPAAPPSGVAASAAANGAMAIKTAAAPAAGAPLRQEFALRVADGRLASGPPALQVLLGTEVTLRIQSDRADELHVHGYDLALRFGAAEPSSLTFRADRSGRFELELHESGLELGALEVLPE